jgi:hypothetical protein
LEGDGSLSIVKFNAASGGQGHGCSYDFNVGTDQARMMEISFDYLWTDVAANADKDFIVYIYDVDKGVLIQPVGYEIFRSGFKSQHKATFQTDATSDDYRVIFHVAQDRADVYSLKVDNLYIGPQRGGVSGAVITDWEPTTMTTDLTGGSGITVTAFEKRVGDHAFYQGRVSWTTVFTGGSFKLNLPRTIDTNKLAINTSYTPLGIATLTDSGSAGHVGSILYSTSTEVEVRYTLASTNYSNSISTTAPFTWANADYIVFEFSVPILGWSSNTVMSEDAGNREIVAQIGLNNSSQSITTTTSTPIEFDTVLRDTCGCTEIGSYGIRIPETGFYDVTIQVFTIDATSGNFYIGVTGMKSLGNYQQLTKSRDSFNATDVVYYTKGTLVTAAVWNQSDSSYSLGPYGNWLSIAKRSSPQTIAQSEKVYAIYKDSSTQSTTNGATITFNTKEADSHGAFSAGIFTAPRAGVVRVSTSILTQAVTGAAGNFFSVTLRKSNVSIRVGYTDTIYVSTTKFFISHLSTDVYLNKGETLKLTFDTNLSTGLLASGAHNYISFTME